MQTIDWTATVSIIGAGVAAAGAGISFYYSRAAHRLERQQAEREARILALHEEDSARRRSEERRRLEESRKADLVPSFVADRGNGAALRVFNRGHAAAEEVTVRLDEKPLREHAFRFPQRLLPPEPTLIRPAEDVRYPYAPSGQDPEYVTVKICWKDPSGVRRETFPQVSTTFYQR